MNFGRRIVEAIQRRRFTLSGSGYESNDDFSVFSIPPEEDSPITTAHFRVNKEKAGPSFWKWKKEQEDAKKPKRTFGLFYCLPNKERVGYYALCCAGLICFTLVLSVLGNYLLYQLLGDKNEENVAPKHAPWVVCTVDEVAKMQGAYFPFKLCTHTVFGVTSKTATHLPSGVENLLKGMLTIQFKIHSYINT